MEESLKAREKIYKERIRGLEEQVELLKDQLAKEMRRRQVFISGNLFSITRFSIPFFCQKLFHSTRLKHFRSKKIPC